MNSKLFRRFSLWVALPLFSIIGVFVTIHTVHAANTPSSLTNFINSAALGSPDEVEANELYEILTSNDFAACSQQGSFASGPVEGQSGVGLWESLEAWLTEGAANLDDNWIEESDGIIQYLYGASSSGWPTLEDQFQDMAGYYEEGTCRLIVSYALSSNIPITGTSTPEDAEDQDRAYNIGKISTNCTAVFSDATSGAYGLPTEISSFLGGLSEETYNNKVKPYATAAAGGSGTECQALVDSIKQELLEAAGPEIACNILGYTTANNLELIACKLGYNNKDNPAICENEYGDNERRETGAHVVAADESAELAACNAGVTGEVEEALVEKETSCAIDFIGWMVCGIMRAAASFNDITYGVVEGILLTAPLNMYQPDGVTPTPQYAVWRTIRDIANVLLVVAFLIIIFSQATSIAISNYGIKKMLPRLIIAAVAINVSYFAMMLAVDLANLIGVGLHNFVGGIADDAFNSAGVSWTSVVDEILSGTIAAGAAAGVAGLVISAGAFSASALGLLALPFVVVAVLAVIAAFITLFVRNALIIVLVIISPLAFAAYLLPNTESLFTRWRKALTSMLLLFPTAALLFAGSKLAAYVIMGSRSGLELFFALVIMTLPLFMLPWLAQQGGSMLKLVGDRLQKLASSAKAPLQKALKPYVENQQEKYRSGRGGFWTRPGKSRTLDKDGNLLDKDGNIVRDKRGNPRKNFAQRWINTRKDMEQQTKNDAERVNLNWQQRAIDNPNGKTAQAIADKEDLHSRSATQEKELKLHEAHRIATPGTFARAYADRGADADSEKKDLDEVEKRRQLERIRSGEASNISGESLADISRRTRTNQEKTKDSELQLEKQNIRDNRELDAAIVSQKASQRTISAIEARQQRDSDRNAAIAGTEEYIAEQDKAFFVEQSEGSTATTKAMIKEASQTDATQMAARDEKFAAEQRTEIVDQENKNVQEARLGEGGDLRPLANRKFKAQEQGELIGQRNKNVQQARLKSDGDLSDLADEKLEAEKQGELIKTQQEAEDEAQLAPGGDLADLQKDIDTAKTEKDVATSKQAEELERRKGDAADLQGLSDEKAASDTATQGYRDAAAARLAAAKAADTDSTKVVVPGMTDEARAKIQSGARQSAIAKTVQSKASGAEELARADEIRKDPTGELARAMAATDDSGPEGIASGISSNTGRVVGAANQAFLKDQQGDEAVAREEFRQLGLGNIEALAVLGVDREDGSSIPEVVRDADGKVVRPSPDDTDKTAAIRQLTSGGDKGANDMLLDTLLQVGIDAEEARQRAALPGATPADIENAEKLTARAKRFQSAAIEEWNKNPGAMPPWISSEDRDEMARGKLARTKKELMLRGFTKGKYNPQNADRWDKDHFKSAAAELGALSPDEIEGMLDDISSGPADKAEKIAAFGKMRATFDALQDDPQYRDHLEEPAKKAIDQLRAKLDDLAATGKVPIPTDYKRYEYAAPGQVRRDAGGNPVVHPDSP